MAVKHSRECLMELINEILVSQRTLVILEDASDL